MTCRSGYAAGLMLCRVRIGVVLLVAAVPIWAAPLVAMATPELVDPSAGTLELVTPKPADRAELQSIDGLAFDSRGNLFGALEIAGAAGGVVHIDEFTGAVTKLVSGISRADQIALHPGGDLFVTSEVRFAATSNRLFRVTVEYDAAHRPVAATGSSVTTSLAIDNPEGIVVLEEDGPFGLSGDLIVAEDRDPGRILLVAPDDGSASLLVAGLRRPEGLAFGDFGGALMPALYAAETSTHSVLRVDSEGNVGVVGHPGVVALRSPDNLEFGPDGFLYISEDRPAPHSRILRIAADGTHSIFATGFGQAAGLAFDPDTGDLYIAEQDLDRVWRVRFHPDPVAIEVIRLEGQATKVDCAFCSRGVEDSLADGELELRSFDPGDAGHGRRHFRAWIELELDSGEDIGLECQDHGSLSYGRELLIGEAVCTLSRGRSRIDACSRFVVRPATGTWEVLVEPSACDAALGTETLRISGALERFELRYEDATTGPRGRGRRWWDRNPRR